MELLKKPSASASGQIICQFLDCQLKPLFREVCLPGGRQDMQLVWTTWDIISPSPKNDIRSSGVCSMKHTLSLSHTMRIKFHLKNQSIWVNDLKWFAANTLYTQNHMQRVDFRSALLVQWETQLAPGDPPEGTWQPAPKRLPSVRAFAPFCLENPTSKCPKCLGCFCWTAQHAVSFTNIPRKSRTLIGDVGFMRVASHFSLEPVLDLLEGVFFLNKTVAKKSSAPKCFPPNLLKKPSTIIQPSTPLGLL